jgi:hypothetical protein
VVVLSIAVADLYAEAVADHRIRFSQARVGVAAELLQSDDRG